MSASSPRRVILLTAAIDSGTVSRPISAAGALHHTVFVTGTGTTSSGVVTIEEADWDPDTEMPYSGTWSVITTLNASDVTGGAAKAYHLPAPSAYAWLRVRVSTVIGGGGSVSASLRSL